ncbi:hypothetical protein CGRA01v4_08765 [Colletotrichum graminicola]|nr:hypothetical protein CGRA01v4_08765 [Colletotrichum graminicola]
MSIGRTYECRGFGPNSQRDLVLSANQASPTRRQIINPPPDGATPDFFCTPDVSVIRHPARALLLLRPYVCFPRPRAPSPA